jgi:hypothetical protein
MCDQGPGSLSHVAGVRRIGGEIPSSHANCSPCGFNNPRNTLR